MFFPPQPWLPKAQQLLDSLTAHQSAGIFLQPVDTTMYKVCVCVWLSISFCFRGFSLQDYVEYVKTPMDLSTAQDKLLSGQYSTPNDFILDLRLMVKNAKTYNRKGSVVSHISLSVVDATLPHF